MTPKYKIGEEIVFEWPNNHEYFRIDYIGKDRYTIYFINESYTHDLGIDYVDNSPVCSISKKYIWKKDLEEIINGI